MSGSHFTSEMGTPAAGQAGGAGPSDNLSHFNSAQPPPDPNSPGSELSHFNSANPPATPANANTNANATAPSDG